MTNAEDIELAYDASPKAMSMQVRADLWTLLSLIEPMRGHGHIGHVPADYVVDTVHDVAHGKVTIPHGKVDLLRALTTLELGTEDERKHMQYRQMRWRLQHYWD
jgi:hypothetical protein